MTNSEDVSKVGDFDYTCNIPEDHIRWGGLLQIELAIFFHNVGEQILGSLPLRDTTRTSILSREWRYKWKSNCIRLLSYMNLSIKDEAIAMDPPDVRYRCRSRGRILNYLNLRFWGTDLGIGSSAGIQVQIQVHVVIVMHPTRHTPMWMFDTGVDVKVGSLII
ncbi:hypothetical protein H5410_042734 [Solanum commersonii]|uniref:Uncharacterized protein n=1 Tax=Solanum commersonii TaxID=4109 RepID=A0A9J5XYH9_SOLCO|nr:hypothetical protein H5410_042734 [Solanum commersonii]